MNESKGFFPATSMPDADWWHALWPRPNEVLERLSLTSEAVVVDLCCGDGLFTLPLARMVESVIAIDLDPATLSVAQNRAHSESITNCTFIVGDAYDLEKHVPIRADVVMIANTFHGVPDKARLAHAVAAALKPEGRFVVINWYPRPREETVVLGQPRGPKTEMRMTPEEVEVAVADARLRRVSVVGLPPYHYAAIFGKLCGNTDRA